MSNSSQFSAQPDADKEQELIRVSPSMFYRHPFWFILTLILCLALVGLIIFWIWWLFNRSIQLIVTTERVILKTGLASVTTDEVPNADITNMVVHQGFFERLGGVGTLKISSSAESDFEIVVNAIPHVQEVATLIRQHQH